MNHSFSKHLIELLEVPDLKEKNIEDLSLKIDFNSRERILIEERKFNSMKKVYDELKKLYTQPQQL